jgi:hypothetical protein
MDDDTSNAVNRGCSYTNANSNSSTSVGERVTQENEKDRGEKVARGTQEEEEMVDIEKSNILLV